MLKYILSFALGMYVAQEYQTVPKIKLIANHLLHELEQKVNSVLKESQKSENQVNTSTNINNKK
jgi:hypothetical protein